MTPENFKMLLEDLEKRVNWLEDLAVRPIEQSPAPTEFDVPPAYWDRIAERHTAALLASMRQTADEVMDRPDFLALAADVEFAPPAFLEVPPMNWDQAVRTVRDSMNEGKTIGSIAPLSGNAADDVVGLSGAFNIEELEAVIFLLRNARIEVHPNE